MFHHAHTYLASKLYHDENPKLQIGSILPDLAVMSIIKWQGNGLHGKEQNQNFRTYIEQNYPDWKSLADGVNAHNIVDDVTHIDYKGEIGYAFQNNKELIELIQEYYGLDYEKARGKAHNFIETGVDLWLLHDFPEFQTKFRLAINQLDKNKLAEILAQYFQIDEVKVLKALINFIELFTRYNFAINEEWIKFWHDLEILMKLKDIGDDKRRILINKALDITKPTYKQFIDTVISLKL